MWLLFGLAAIAAAGCNLLWAAKGKDSRRFMFISLSFTALTLCATYSADARWVINQDWSALADVTPTMASSLWFCTIVSILLNGVTVFQKPES